MVKRCPLCGRYIEWLLTRYGRKLPFDYQPVPVTDPAAATGWAPGQWYVRGSKRVVLQPLEQTSHTRRANIRFVVIPHGCDRYYQAMFDGVTSSVGEP